MKKILILGSINIDLTIETPYIPAAGETVTGRNFLVNPGGKGANQAVAARRLGGTVCFSGCVGDDAFGRESMKNFQRCGLDISGVRTVENCPTGCAVIAVCGGDNRIILDRGANAAVTCADADALIGRAAAGDIFLTQLEIDLSVVGYALRRAKESGLYTVLNPAPADGRIVRYFPYVDLITPNESELALLTGESDCARGAAKLAVPEVVVTRGKKGYYYAGKSGSFYGGCPAVKAIDTTAAGDTFCGALAGELSRGEKIRTALTFAAACASLACTHRGAQQSVPRREEALALLQRSD